MSKDPTISFRSNASTVKKAISLKKLFNVNSRSDAIRMAIELSAQLMGAIQKGDKVIIESKNGDKKVVILPGINVV